MLYAGDNDLGDGRHPEEVYLFFFAVVGKLSSALPEVAFSFLSIKISPSRWNIAQEIANTNKLISGEIAKNTDYQYIDMTTPLLGVNGKPRQEFFESDGLHLSPAGYRIWQRELVRQARILNDLFT